MAPFHFPIPLHQNLTSRELTPLPTFLAELNPGSSYHTRLAIPSLAFPIPIPLSRAEHFGYCNVYSSPFDLSRLHRKRTCPHTHKKENSLALASSLPSNAVAVCFPEREQIVRHSVHPSVRHSIRYIRDKRSVVERA